MSELHCVLLPATVVNNNCQAKALFEKLHKAEPGPPAVAPDSRPGYLGVAWFLSFKKKKKTLSLLRLEGISLTL